MGGGKLALAIVGGYLLGRTKKMKLAIMLGGALAGKKISTDPAALLGQATKLVNASPELQRLDAAVRGRLMEAGKDAALAVASSRMEALTDNLVGRVENLGKPAAGATKAAGEAAGAAGDTVTQAGGAAGDAATVTAGAAKDTVSGAARGVRGKGRSKKSREPRAGAGGACGRGRRRPRGAPRGGRGPRRRRGRGRPRRGLGRGALGAGPQRQRQRPRLVVLARLGAHRPGAAAPRPSGPQQLGRLGLGDEERRHQRHQRDERVGRRELAVDGEAVRDAVRDLVVDQPQPDHGVGHQLVHAVPVGHVGHVVAAAQEGR